MTADAQQQVTFHLTGERSGDELEDVAALGLRPALLAGYGDLPGLRYDYPLVMAEGTSWHSLGLKGDETLSISGIRDGLQPRMTLEAEIRRANGEMVTVPLTCRIDTLDELEYFNNGGILHYVLRQLAA